MPDIAPLLVGVLAAAAAACLAVAAIGRVDRTSPRCRVCGADARQHAWSQPARCSCGNDLSRRRGIRVSTRRRPRLALVGLVFAALAFALGWWATSVYARGIGWRHELPTSLFAATLRWNYLDSNANQSLFRRLMARPPREEARALLAGYLDLIDADPGVLAQAADSDLLYLANAAKPEGELGERFVRTAADLVDCVANATEDSTMISVLPVGRWGGGIAGELVLRVDRVLVDDKVVPWHADPEFLGWCPIGDCTPRIEIDQRADDPSSIRIEGEVVYAGELPDGIGNSGPLVSQADPKEWGLPLARSSCDWVARAVKRELPPGWSYSTPSWGRWEALLGPRLHSAQPPRLAAVPVLRTAIVGVVAGLVFAVGWLAALAFLRRAQRLAAPHCGRCVATLRGQGDLLPDRCAECGRVVAGVDDVNWTRSRGRWLPPWLVAAMVMVAWCGAVGIGLSLRGPECASGFGEALATALVTPDYYGRWSGGQALNAWSVEDEGGARNALAQLAWASINGTPEDWTAAQREEAQRTAVHEVAARWRQLATRATSGVDANARIDVLDAALGTARVVARAIDECELDSTVALRDVRDLLRMASAPRLVQPICVVAGQDLRLLELSRAGSSISVFVRTKADAGETPSDWSLSSRASLPYDHEPGDHRVDFEWVLVFPEMSGQFQQLSDNEIQRHLAKLPLRGEGSMAIRVLPAGGHAIVVTDPTLNPMHRAPPIQLSRRVVGEHAELVLLCSTIGLGVDLYGEWIVELAGSPVPLRRSSRSRVEWSAVVAADTELPESLVARFEPHAPEEKAQGRTRVFWGGEASVSLHRAPMPQERGLRVRTPDAIYVETDRDPGNETVWSE